MTDVSPKAITDAERPYSKLAPDQLDGVLVYLFERGVHQRTVNGLNGYLRLLRDNPRLAQQLTSKTTRTLYRRILAEHQPPIPPAGRHRREGGFLSLGLGTVVAGTAAAAIGHPVAGLALVGSLVITTPDGEPVEALPLAA